MGGPDGYQGLTAELDYSILSDRAVSESVLGHIDNDVD